MKLIVEVDKGSNVGTRYEIGPRSYRAIGRAGSKEVTVQLTEDGDAPLEPAEIETVEAHLTRRRAGNEDGQDRIRLGAYRRGRDILLEDEKVSRTHAMIFVDEDGASVVDLLSTNGTHVNGHRVGDADLGDGDSLYIGKTRFIVRLSPAD